MALEIEGDVLGYPALLKNDGTGALSWSADYAPLADASFTGTTEVDMQQWDVFTSNTAVLTLDGTKTWNIATNIGSSWTLPPVSGNAKKLLFVQNRSSLQMVLSRNGSDNIFDSGVVTSITIPIGGVAMLYNDGTYWKTFSPHGSLQLRPTSLSQQIKSLTTGDTVVQIVGTGSGKGGQLEVFFNASPAQILAPDSVSFDQGTWGSYTADPGSVFFSKCYHYDGESTYTDFDDRYVLADDLFDEDGNINAQLSIVVGNRDDFDTETLTVGRLMFAEDARELYYGDTAETAGGKLVVEPLAWRYSSVTTTANAGGGEDSLALIALPVSTAWGGLTNNGDSYEFFLGGRLGSLASGAQLKLYYGGSTPVSTGQIVVESGTIAGPGPLEWSLRGTITRLSNTIVAFDANLVVADDNGAVVTQRHVPFFMQNPVTDLTAANYLQLTGESGSSTTNDVVLRNVSVRKHRA